MLLISVVLSWIFYDFSVVGGLNSSEPKVGIGAEYGREQELKNDWRIVVRLYRGPLLFVIFMFLMGINVYGWRSSGVNHVLIFELDPRNHLSEQHIMELAGILCYTVLPCGMSFTQLWFRALSFHYKTFEIIMFYQMVLSLQPSPVARDCL